MITTRELHGYKLGQRIEVRPVYNGDWQPGVIIGLDKGDIAYPYKVVVVESGEVGWYNPVHVRTLPEPQPASRYEWRIVTMGDGLFTAHNSTLWESLELGGDTINVALGGSIATRRLEIRKVPARSAEEILVRLREVTNYTDMDLERGVVLRILNGEF